MLIRYRNHCRIAIIIIYKYFLYIDLTEGNIFRRLLRQLEEEDA